MYVIDRPQFSIALLLIVVRGVAVFLHRVHAPHFLAVGDRSRRTGRVRGGRVVRVGGWATGDRSSRRRGVFPTNC